MLNGQHRLHHLHQNINNMDESIKYTIEKLEKILEGDQNKKGLVELVRDHDKYISDGKGWRACLASLVGMFFIQIVAGIFFYGRLVERVESHDKSIERLIDKSYHNYGRRDNAVKE